MRRVIGVVAVLCFCAVLAGSAQAVQAQGVPVANVLRVQDIDTSEYPVVSVTAAIPGAEAESIPRFTIAENGEAIREYESEPALEAQPVKVTLVFDTSGSMTGRPIMEARRAAAAFLRALGDEVPVASVAFNERVQSRSRLTTDHARVNASLMTLGSGRETALYDAIITAVENAQVKDGERHVVVLLSDGGDTVSVASLEAAMDALVGAGVPLYAVALESPEQNPRALQRLSDRSGGRVYPVADAAELASLFEGIAQEILGTYRVTYTSIRPDTKDVELDIAAITQASSAEAQVSYRNPDLLLRPATGGEEIVVPQEDTGRLWLALLLGGLAALLAAWAIMRLILRQRNMLSHVRLYEQDDRRAGWRGALGPIGGLRRRWSRFVGAMLDRFGISQRLAAKLDSVGLPRAASEYAGDYTLAMLLITLIAQLLAGNVLFTIFILVALMIMPAVLLDMKGTRNRRAIERQLPDTLAMLATSMRGGWTIERSMQLVADEGPVPISHEFGRAMTSMDLGMPVHEVLEQMGKRIHSSDFDAVVSGVAVQREVGGNLAEVLDMVADTMRERENLRRQVRTLTSETRFSAYILIALPFVLVLMMFLTSPSYIMALGSSALGIGIAVLSLVMIAGGSFWIFRITKIEV